MRIVHQKMYQDPLLFMSAIRIFSQTAVLLKAWFIYNQTARFKPQAPVAIPCFMTRLQTMEPSAAVFTTAVFRVVQTRSAAHITPSALTQTAAVAPYPPSGMSIQAAQRRFSLPIPQRTALCSQAGTTVMPNMILPNLLQVI